VTILVTGATGFVGAAVARRLVASGRSVRVLVRPGSDRQNLESLPIEIVTGDLTDPGSLTRALTGCEGLFHVAAEYSLWVKDPAAMYRSNVEGTRAIMQAAAQARVGRIVYTSSVATIGINDDGSPADEDTPSKLSEMIGHYKRSKFMAEEIVRDLAAGGLPIVVVNPSTPVGPGDIKPTPTGRLIVDALSGYMPAYVDTGLNVVHVDDVAEGHLLAYERGTIGRRYVLGGTDMTLRQILTECAQIAGRRPPSLRLPHTVIMPIAYVAEGWSRLTGRPPRTTVDGVRLSRKRMYFSSARAERELGYRARDACVALRDAAAWFGTHGYVRFAATGT
jgi:dihydroflavonol-4-reductase